MKVNQTIIDIIEQEKVTTGYYLDTRTAYAQMAHETGHFTSNIYKSYNNVSGMLPSSRNLHVSGTNTPEGQAAYATVADSVRDYLLRMRQFGIPSHLKGEEFYKTIQLEINKDLINQDYTAPNYKYAVDPLYSKLSTNLYNQIKLPVIPSLTEVTKPPYNGKKVTTIGLIVGAGALCIYGIVQLYRLVKLKLAR